MRPLLIGQAPSRGSDPALPLSGRSGGRLAALCGVDASDLRRRFDLLNLLDRWPGKDGKRDAFPVDAARRRAIDLLLSGRMFGRRVVMLGGAVALTFGIRRYDYLRWSANETLTLAVAPHPSGVSRWWNDEANVEIARAFWHDLAVVP